MLISSSVFRLKAFSAHLSFSFIVVLVSLYVVFFIWYPQPLYTAAGVTKIFLIMLLTYLVIGPVLTFIISKPNKKTLKIDLVVIILLQLSALMYGLYHVYDGRPVWIVYDKESFDIVWNNNIDTRKVSEALPEYQRVSRFRPKYVAAVIPKENGEISNEFLDELLSDEFNYGIVPSQRLELYQPLSTVDAEIVDRAKYLEELYEYNDKAEVDRVLSQYPAADSFLPLKAIALDMVVLINKQDDVKVIGIVDLRPWS